MSSTSGSGRMKKGAVNVAEVGTAACKSRAASNVRDDASASETGYRRCHGERAGGIPLVKLVLEPSVRKETRVSEHAARAWSPGIKRLGGPVMGSPGVWSRNDARSAARGIADHLKHQGFVL